jgi:hypothetical protein
VSDEQSAAKRLRDLLDDARLPAGGISISQLADETAPVLSLLSELPPNERVAGDYDSFEFRECFTVLTLLGRRLALLDLTPTTAIQIVHLALHAVDGSGGSPCGKLVQRAVAAAMEGFVMGREERVALTSEERAAKPITPLRIDEAVFALIVSGVHEPSVLSECVDALGRAMLDANVEAAVVDLTQLGEPSGERATAMFGADEVTRMLGGVCFFAGVDSRWREAAAEARIELHGLHITRNLAEALASARDTTERIAKARRSTWQMLFDRFRRYL